MNIFVAGGAGYIGSTTTQLLLNAGHSVTVFDSLVKGYRAAIPEGAKFVQGDILDRESLNKVFEGSNFDAVLHFAAFIEAGESMVDPAKFFHNNVVGSMTLIEAVSRHQIPRFVFSSTAGVYASKDSPINETDPFGPASVYGQTKLMIEETLEWYHRVKGLQFAALRYFNAAGATPPMRGEAHRPESHLIPLVLQVALGQRENIAIFGDDYPTPDGTCIRDYIHISDLAAAHLLALTNLDDNNSRMVYNLGNGTGYSVKEVIETAREVTGHDIPAVSKPRRPGDAAILVGDASRIKKDLGWEPETPDLKSIISSAWSWHHSHPDGYNS